MFTRQLIRKKKFPKVYFTYAKRSSHQTAKSVAANQEVQWPSHEKKNPSREPFAKNLFIGKFDTKFATYPEPKSDERYKLFFKWLQPIEAYIASCNEATEELDQNTILSTLASLDVFRGSIGTDYGGLDLSQTELTRLVEAISSLPWLGTHLIKNNILPAQIISKYGTEKQKLNYYPKIMSGEIIPTICLMEDESGFNISNIKTQALIERQKNYVLKGTKTLVVNGMSSNLFLVFSSVQNNLKQSIDKASVFLVESDFGGITCSNKQSTSDHDNSHVCTITFDNTVVPMENILGGTELSSKVLIELLIPGRQNVAVQAITILRNFIGLLTPYVLEKKHYDKEFYKFEAVKVILGKIAMSLYGMESTTYLTNGIADEYEKQDVDVERAITETYCLNECVKSIFMGLHLLDTKGNLREYPFKKLLDDALALSLCDGNFIDGDTYIAAVGLQHAGRYLHDHVYKARNSVTHPIYNLKRIFEKNKVNSLYIEDYLHPSLRNAAKCIENSIYLLKRSVLRIFELYGLEVVDRQAELQRISEIVTEIYVATAIVGRASRSYCIGLPHSEEERNLAMTAAYLAESRVKDIANKIELGEWGNGDYIYKQVADSIYKKNKYFMEHPLNRTF